VPAAITKEEYQRLMQDPRARELLCELAERMGGLGADGERPVVGHVAEGA
jgi:hypothetical protein